MSGNTIGSLVGGAVGFLIGGPTGAKWGFFIGGQIGGYVDPQKIKGPRLTDATRQTSMEGIPIPWGYGTFPTMGNIIFAGPLVEHEHEDGGKGGPVTVSYTYTRSYAIGICEGPISGIQKIKRNGKLVYDISPTSTIATESAKFLENATIYLGDETQNVDPTIEAIVGVGETGPYRGLAYMVLEDDDLTETQGAIAQYEFVVQMCGTLTTTPAATITDLAEFYYPLQGDYVDHKGMLADLVPTVLGVSWEGAGLKTSYPPGGNAHVTQGTGVDGASSWTISAVGQVNSFDGLGDALIAAHVTNTVLGYHTWGLYVTYTRCPFVSVNGTGGFPVIVGTSDPVDFGETFVITLRRTPGFVEMFLNGRLVDKVVAAGSVISGTGQLFIGGSYTTHSTGHLWGVASALSDDEIRVLAAQQGVDTGLTEIPDSPGAYTDADGNVISIGQASDSLSSCTAILSDIVDDLCFRSGIDVATEVDTSELTDIVTGFKCATESGADQFIQSLTLSHFFDRAEWDKKLRFPKRGGASVATITADDLVIRDGAPIVQTRIQEPELLRKVNVLSIDPAADYNITKQTWERRAGTIKAVGEASLEIPEVVETDTAAQIAEISGKIAWAETDKFAFGLAVKWSKLTPTDLVTLVDKASISHRIRLQSLSEQLGLLEIGEGVKDRTSVYSSTARGVVNPNTPGTTSSGLVGPSIFTVMNLPRLRDQDGSGIYAGAAGLLAGWSGGVFLISFDSGSSYTTALTITRPTKIGVLTADCTSSSEPVQVHVYGGDLENKTTAQVGLGANWAAIAALGGAAEVMAYEDATETTDGYWDLETNTRGLQDTTAAAHSAGDYFMDLATCYFIPVSSDRAGATLYLKFVPFGVSADAISPISLVLEGLTVIHDGGLIT